MEQGLVSCICLTSNKIGFVQRIIGCFESQTYPLKELIVVYEDNNLPLIEFLKDFKHAGNIHFCEVPISPKLTIGELRNFGIEKSNGQYFCQWDDDDWFHNRRIELQIVALESSCKGSSLLSNWIMFDMDGDNAYLSETRIWEGTILCKKSVYYQVGKYPALPLGEDSGYVKKLFVHNLMYPVVMPNLYIYVCHGRNSYPRDHFDDLFQKSQKLSPSFSAEIKKILQGVYSNEDASAILSSQVLLEELNYFHSYL